MYCPTCHRYLSREEVDDALWSHFLWPAWGGGVFIILAGQGFAIFTGFMIAMILLAILFYFVVPFKCKVCGDVIYRWHGPVDDGEPVNGAGVCSVCGREDYREKRFCGHCGADME